MGYDERVYTESCGCRKIYKEHDFFSYTKDVSYEYCDYHKKKAFETKAKEVLYEFTEQCKDMEYIKTPIKYFQDLENEMLLKDISENIGKKLTLDYELLKICKEGGRYYCCKKRVDAFKNGELQKYYEVIPWKLIQRTFRQKKHTEGFKKFLKDGTIPKKKST